MSMILESKVGGDYKPHPEGIYPAVCVDLIELGLMESEYMGVRRWVNKVRVVFETEQKNEEGKNCTLSKTFTASLNTKAKLAEFLGKWRGRPIAQGERVDLDKLIGACCTLVLSQQQNAVGRTYTSIDAVSKPTKRLVASGGYDPVLARQRVAEWKAKVSAPPAGGSPGAQATAPAAVAAPSGARPLNPVAAAFPQNGGAAAPAPKSAAPLAALAAAVGDFDPEVGF
jgi:hypothetical protein